MLKEGWYKFAWKPTEIVYVQADGTTALTPDGKQKRITVRAYGSMDIIKESELQPIDEKELLSLRDKASKLVLFIDTHKPTERKS